MVTINIVDNYCQTCQMYYTRIQANPVFLRHPPLCDELRNANCAAPQLTPDLSTHVHHCTIPNTPTPTPTPPHPTGAVPLLCRTLVVG